ncbi:MAG: UpxY family transcription antiterminator [bacterium]
MYEQASFSDNMRNVPHWYALYTRPRFEKKVDSILQEKRLESYLPLQTTLRRWSDRWKKITEPLFSCYVFVRIPLREKVLAIQTRGVVRMVMFNSTPSPIPDFEIYTLKNILQKTDRIEPVPYLKIGQMVEVVNGPFEGIRGRLIEQRGRKKLVVGIEQLKQAISIEVNAFDLRLVTDQSGKAKGA